MTGPAQSSTLLTKLQTALDVSGLDPSHPLHQEVKSWCAGQSRVAYRIAVFAPFNYGKSTLLNAMLGDRTLPMDLIPTTGAAIRVRYGETLRTRVQLMDGSVLEQDGTDILKEYAILDDQRRMRDDVTAIEVFNPHSFLASGVEFLDLPGTDDQEAQDVLVKEQLLTADLVIQVLDARKLMTLAEREQLRDWLLDRGLTTVVLVANFVNLMDPDEQKQISQRLRFVAESFRQYLPQGISNLYRVDALPALRARLSGDGSLLWSSGLPAFESALQSIVRTQREQGRDSRLPRLKVLMADARQALQDRAGSLQETLQALEQSRIKKIELKQKAQQLFKQGYMSNSIRIRDFLSLNHLLTHFQSEAAQALMESNFESWEYNQLSPQWEDQARSIMAWVNKAAEFFSLPLPTPLSLVLPDTPELLIKSQSTQEPGKLNEATPIALAAGLGFVFGGPVGAAVMGGASYFVNKAFDSDDPSLTESPESTQLHDAAMIAAKDYLNRFSTIALSALHRYEASADKIINVAIQEPPVDDAPEHQDLQDVHQIIQDLTQTLEQLESQ